MTVVLSRPLNAPPLPTRGDTLPRHSTLPDPPLAVRGDTSRAQSSQEDVITPNGGANDDDIVRCVCVCVRACVRACVRVCARTCILYMVKYIGPTKTRILV